MHWIFLATALAALAFGPIAYAALTRHRHLSAMLDGFIFVSIGGIVLIELLPSIMATGGGWILLALVGGLFGPSVAERLLHRAARQTHLLTLLLGSAGLVLHATADGAALHAGDHGATLALAIVLHRLPVGLAVWWLLKPSFGTRVAVGMIGAMAAGTVVGSLIGAQSAHVHTAQAVDAFALLQAFVAGSILHVVFNKPHLGDDFAVDRHRQIPASMEGIGNLLGLILLVGVITLHPATDIDGPGAATWQRLLDLALTSAPALLIGYTLAAALGVLLPMSPLQWLRRGRSGTQALKGMVVGLPLPVCSCGVLPLYRNLMARGAPPTAGLAFLVATPELGLDAILLSLPLLGGPMTLARVLAAALLALAVGWLVGRRLQRLESPAPEPSPPDPAASAPGCCDTSEHTHDAPTPPSPPTARGRAFVHQLGELVDATGAWILLGLLIAAMAQPLLQADWLTALPDAVQVAGFAVIGIPLYICATGATPIVAVMLAAGLSPGAGLALLLAGPATNVATFGVVAGVHGKRAAAAFAVATVGGAVLLGWTLNALVGGGMAWSQPTLEPHAPSIWQITALAALTVLFLAAMMRRGARAFFAEGIAGGHLRHAH